MREKGYRNNTRGLCMALLAPLALLLALGVGEAGEEAVEPLLSFPQERGLVAYWSFDEGEGKIAHDYSGMGNDAQIRGANWVEGVSGKALSFDGRSVLICGGGLELSFVFPADYSLEVWVKHTSKDPQIYISKWTGSGSESGWWLGYYERAVQFGDYYEGGQIRIKGQDIADGKWHYIVGVRKGNKLSLYVDGQKVAEGESPRKVAGDNLAPLLIGDFGNPRYPKWPFKGAIDEVRVYSRALSEEEIQESYRLIKSGTKPLTLSPITRDVPLQFFFGATIASIYKAKEPINCSLVIVASKPISQQDFIVRVEKEKGESVENLEVVARFGKGQRVKRMEVELPPLEPGAYRLAIVLGREKKLEKTFTVRDFEPVERENIRIREGKTRENPFYRGIVSAYAGMRYKPDGTPDIEAMLSTLKDLGVNCYTYLIAYRSDKELSALGDFCDRALEEGIEVWAYLIPPSEAPIDRDKPAPERRYPPYDMDYLKWASAIAKISLAHPNLTLWMIDDFDGNLSFFTLDYTRQIYQTSKSINPKLLFGVCVYHESLKSFVEAGYLPYTDAILWGYQHSSFLYPDCGLYANSLPLEINDYLKTGKIAIPCIYFTPHSSWPEGRPTKEYLEKAMDIAFEQAGIVWIFTTPSPGSFQYDVVKSFTRSHQLPEGKWRGF